MNSLFLVLFSFYIVVDNIIITDASGILYSADNVFQYPNHIPYALGYSYIQSPYILPYAYSIQLKHHHPDHKDDDKNSNNSEIDMKTEDGKLPEMITEASLLSDDKMKSDMEQNNLNNMKIENVDNKNSSDNNSNDLKSQQPTSLPNIASVNSMQMPQTTGQLKYYTFSYPITYTVPTPLNFHDSPLFHLQDNNGHYYYGYNSPESSKQELKGTDGVTRGAYSYIDGDGKLQTVYYVSDSNGFRVIASNLPKAPEPVHNPDGSL